MTIDCGAAGNCNRPARTIVITPRGASYLCDRHDTIAHSLAITRRADLQPAHIVAPVREVQP